MLVGLLVVAIDSIVVAVVTAVMIVSAFVVVNPYSIVIISNNSRMRISEHLYSAFILTVGKRVVDEELSDIPALNGRCGGSRLGAVLQLALPGRSDAVEWPGGPRGIALDEGVVAFTS